MNDVQEALARLREAGWTDAAIADAIGVSHRAVQDWRSGRRYPATPGVVLGALNGLMDRKAPKQRRYGEREHIGPRDS